MDVAALVTLLGGVAKRDAIVSQGAAPHQIEAACRRGEITRVARGWYATLPITDPRVISVRCGGILTGAAALDLYGTWLWTPPRRLDVLVPRGATPNPPIPKFVDIAFGGPARVRAAVVPLTEALSHFVLKAPLEEAVAALDWARHTATFDEADLDAFCARLPKRLQMIGARVDPACESVLESIVRTRLLAARHHVTSQVPVGASQRIDLVVDGAVGLELDGRTFHADTFETDRRKDLEIVLDGMIAVRASYAMVQSDWERVHEGIDAAAAKRRKRSV